MRSQTWLSPVLHVVSNRKSVVFLPPKKITSVNTSEQFSFSRFDPQPSYKRALCNARSSLYQRDHEWRWQTGLMDPGPPSDGQPFVHPVAREHCSSSGIAFSMLVFDASPVHRWVDCFGPDKTGPNVCAIARVCCTTDRPLINRGGELLVNIVSKIECLLALATLGHTGLVCLLTRCVKTPLRHLTVEGNPFCRLTCRWHG